MIEWAELERFSVRHPEIHCICFMFMGKTEDGIFLYKHYDTRRYLSLKDGQCYVYQENKYIHVPVEVAIKRVLS